MVFFSEEKWLEDKTQVLSAAINHVERLKMEKEKLSEQRCRTYSPYISSSSLLSSLCHKKQFYLKCFQVVMDTQIPERS